jgi:hypothetical protein
MRAAAVADPALYREIHQFALSAFGEAQKLYHITANPALIPDVFSLKDSELPALFENENARQLIHITYGQILGSKKDGAFVFKDRLYKLWNENETAYTDALIKHIGRHVSALGIKQE